MSVLIAIEVIPLIKDALRLQAGVVEIVVIVSMLVRGGVALKVE
jgi:hypothetical protein